MSRRPPSLSAVTRVSFLHQLPDAGDGLAAVQLDVGHEGFVGQAAGAVLQVKARSTQRAQVGGDLLGDGSVEATQCRQTGVEE